MQEPKGGFCLCAYRSPSIYRFLLSNDPSPFGDCSVYTPGLRLIDHSLFYSLLFTIAMLYCFVGKYCLQPDGTSSFIRHLDLRPRASFSEASLICIQITFHRTLMRMVCGSFFLDFIQTKTFSRQTLSRSPAWVNLLIHFIKLSLWVKIEQSKKLLLYFASSDYFRDPTTMRTLQR